MSDRVIVAWVTFIAANIFGFFLLLYSATMLVRAFAAQLAGQPEHEE
jgi:hypothetical protein